MSRTRRPCWSSDSTLSMAGRPAARSRTRAARTRGGHGSPGGGMRSAKRCSEPLAMGRSSSAAVAARRKASEASSETAAVGSEGDLAVDVHHVGADGAIGVAASARSVAPPRRSRRRRPGRRIPQPAPAPHVVADPGDLAPGRRDGGHEGVGVGEVQGGGDLVLILEEQPVLFAPGDPVQLHPDPGEDGGGLGRGRPGRRSRPAAARRPRSPAAR